jgi:hypothetical protein
MSRYASTCLRHARLLIVLPRILSVALFATLLAALTSCAATPPADAPVAGAVIVKPRVAAPAEVVVRAVQQPLGESAGVRYARPLAGDAHLVYLTSPATREQLPALIERLRASGAFQYVEADSMMKIQ